MRNAADEVKAALRAKGFDVRGFYGSGDDPSLGWVRVWWSHPPGPRHGLNIVMRLPDGGPDTRDSFRRKLRNSMAESGYEQRSYDDKCVWRRKAVTP